MNADIRLLIELLYCNCSKLNHARPYNEYLALKSFASAIGGEIFTNELNTKIDTLLKDYVDYLPYGKYQLRFKGAAKLFLDLIFETELPELKDVNACTKYSKKQKPTVSEYFVCKSCCPVCKSSARGCPLHCCTLCWKYLALMSLVNVNKNRRVIKKVKQRNALISHLKDLIKSDQEIIGLNVTTTEGYLHSIYDVVLFLYLNYEYDDAEIKRIILALMQYQ